MGWTENRAKYTPRPTVWNVTPQGYAIELLADRKVAGGEAAQDVLVLLLAGQGCGRRSKRAPPSPPFGAGPAHPQVSSEKSLHGENPIQVPPRRKNQCFFRPRACLDPLAPGPPPEQIAGCHHKWFVMLLLKELGNYGVRFLPHF